jgi:uncharacterized protein (TIGR02145 family)
VNEILQEVLIHYNGVGVPGTGGISQDGGPVLPTMVIALGVALAFALIFALCFRKKSVRRILVPVAAAVLGLSGIIATTAKAATLVPYTDTVELSLSAPATDVSAMVDLSGLYTTYGGAPKSITVQNISNANVTVNTTPDGTSQTLAVDVTIPNGLATGDYTAEIVYTYPSSLVTMDDMNPTACSELTTWDGSNGEMLELEDKRDGNKYNIAKLADGKCWMLNNLRLGSQTGTMTLTPADTNISSNWTLPQVMPIPSTAYDAPHVYGPVPGDSNDINSDTDYGYFYNWCAATAGGTASGSASTCTTWNTMPSDSTGDVCPANWRLPKGGDYNQAGNEFANLVATLAGYPSNTDAGFVGAFNNGSTFAAGIQSTGAFRGNYGGSRGNLTVQGSIGYWWSGSANPSNSSNAFYLNVSAGGYVGGGVSVKRDEGFAVRCLLK